MKKSLSVDVEILLPTNVTKEIKLPLFYVSKVDGYVTMISENEDGYDKINYPFIKTELKKYTDGSITRFVTSASLDKLKQIIASMDMVDDSIVADEFLLLAQEYANQIIAWFNHIYEQNKNN